MVNIKLVEVVSAVIVEDVTIVGPFSHTLNQTEPLPSNAAALLGAFAM